MKKMLITLMMVMMSVVMANAQIVTAANYGYIYVSLDGGLTSYPIERGVVPYGNMISKGDFLPTKLFALAREEATRVSREQGAVLNAGVLMAERVAEVRNFFVLLKQQIQAQAEITAAAASEVTSARTTTRQQGTGTLRRTNTTVRQQTTPRVNPNRTYNVSTGRFENIESLVNDY